MRGVRYLIDESGQKTAVLIDLKKHGEIGEDFFDRAVAEARKNEPRESIAAVRKRIAKSSRRSKQWMSIRSFLHARQEKNLSVFPS